VYVTHGNSDGLARYLREVEAISAEPLEGDFSRERGEAHETNAVTANSGP
jgi:putative mRNA 3-end processing factor